MIRSVGFLESVKRKEKKRLKTGKKLKRENNYLCLHQFG